MNITDIVILLAVFYMIYLLINKEQNKEPLKEHFNMDKIYFQNRHLVNTHGEKKLIETAKIKFDYSDRPIDMKFKEEQKNGVNMKTWYPNTWIEKIDKKGKPIENSREKITGQEIKFVEANARNSIEFNELRPAKVDGVVDPNDFNGVGKSIREIYDNSFVDFKKTVEKKEFEEKDTMVKAASGLSYFSPDTWVYKDEKPENGGIMEGGVYAADLSSFGSVATF